ncbi:MAG: DUF2911 domain-containing protein, partial [Gemmatimonadota bacterium]
MRFNNSAHPSFAGISLGFGLLVFAGCAPSDGAEATTTAQTASVEQDQAIQPLPIATAQSGAVVASQGAAVSQNLAQAQITVVFNRPVARGREIFGHLVPFGAVWHPGADQATYLRTTADILFGGELLPAGRYSVWAVPGPDEWEIILHRDWDVFHLPFPGEDGVQLRLTVTPQNDADHMESLAFYFPVADARSGVLAFHWGNTKLEIPIEAPGP